MIPAALLPMLPSQPARMYPYTFKSVEEFFAGPLETVDDFKDLIERFKKIIHRPDCVPPSLYAYLDEDDSGVVDVIDMLYWVDKKLKENKATIGYTNRLSEAGGDWGAAAPTTLSQADPLGLVATLESLECKVVVVDHDAALSGDNVTANAPNGCVKIIRGTNNCTTLDDDLKNPQGLFNGGSYRYRFIQSLDFLHEHGGGGLRFPSAPVESVWLVRNNSSTHVVNHENIIGARIEVQRLTVAGTPTSGTYTITWTTGTTDPLAFNATADLVQAALRELPGLEQVTVTSTGNSPNFIHSISFFGVEAFNPAQVSVNASLDTGTIEPSTFANGDVHNTRILIRGYPGEWPEIWCGSSTDNDESPTACAETSTWIISSAATKKRDNMHWRGIHFHGKRPVGDDWVFTPCVLQVSGNGTGNSVRHCKFTDTQPMSPHDDNATSLPQYVDAFYDLRSSKYTNNIAWRPVRSNSRDFVFDSNYVKPAGVDFPLPLTYDSGTGNPIDGFIGNGFRFDGGSVDGRCTRNRFEGICTRAQIWNPQTIRSYIADNYIFSPNYKYVFCPDCIDTTIERNFCVANGTIPSQSGAGIDCGERSSGNVVRWNVCWSEEPLTSGSQGISITDNNRGGGTVTSSAVDSGSVAFTVSSGHGIVVGQRLVVLGHSVSGYNGGHNVVGVSGNVITTDTPYTSSGTGGTWQSFSITQNIHVYENIVYGPGVALGWSAAWDDHDRHAEAIRDVVIERNIIHGFPAANTANSVAAPVRVKLYAAVPYSAGSGSMQPSLGNVIRENNITRDSGTAAIAVRTRQSAISPALAADFYAVTDSLAGFVDNTAIDPEFADPENGDFTLPGNSPFLAWFEEAGENMPFNESLSKAWTPE